MKITIEFYGKLKAEFSEHPIEWQSDAVTVNDIYHQLCKQHQKQPNTQVIKPIINDSFCDWQQVVNDGDVIGFFPPASGG
ncbi:MoaD/ThiS family protein [Marinicella litoralis]|uniref:Molybdopterin converting factor small subunit n=1 Tax=Marinicella litoralis TaxID=644220 RepID=A0A4R6XJ51_9GAMM|nr:MoaD/ThiS family protein [Marinicella litoralis]TDR18369.1 molybdopterin converting factor small subunit [Marinicella litoralis]